MKFVFFTFDGVIFSAAYKLKMEGHDVYVCQIRNAGSIGADCWVSDKEMPENKNRRLSLYDGLLDKMGLPAMMDFLRSKRNKEQYFILFDHNNLYKLSEQVLGMGYTNGLFPTEYDYNMEKDRKMAKEFVQQFYPDIKLKELQEFHGVDKVIKFIQESPKLWVVKSDGNFAETLVPDKDDLELSKKQIIGELTENKKDFEKGGIIVEEKIVDAIEFNVEAAFYNGKPIYTQVEIETRMFGCLDIGAQTGGNQNLTINTRFEDRINEIAFPSIIGDEANSRKGLYLRDIGILSDGRDLYFTEFAGNRYGWPGVFSEFVASSVNGNIYNYFDKIVKGENPFMYKYGVSVSLYTLNVDADHPGLPKDSVNLMVEDEWKDRFFLYQIKQKEGKKKEIESVGYRLFGDAPLGYVTGCADTIEDAASKMYAALEHFSMKGIYYRPYSDFMAMENNKCIMKRLDFLKRNDYITL